MIRALVVRRDADPVVEDLSDSLEAMRAIVGGWIEHVRCGPGLALWCNESGLVDGLPPNRRVFGFTGSVVIHGDFFMTGIDDEGELRSLTAEEIAKLRTMLGPSTPPRGGTP